MLKLLFALLLLANAGLFAYQQGYLEALLPDGREPARLSGQINPDQIKLISADAARAKLVVPDEPEAEPAPAVAATAQPALSCTEVGNFEAADAKRFETRLAALSLGDKLSRRTVQEVARHMVYIPPQGDKEGADKKANELRRLGIKDFYVIQDTGELHWGISLGIFKTEEAARAHLAALGQKGVRSARLGLHNVTANKIAFQIRGLDQHAKGVLDKIKTDFPAQEIRTCAAEQA